MAIEYKDGFIVGERRAKEMAEGIKKTEDNTKQILEVLVAQFRSMQQAIGGSTAADAPKRIDTSNRIREAKKLNDEVSKDNAVKVAKAIQSAIEQREKNTSKRVREAVALSEAVEKARRKTQSSTDNSVKSRVQRERDANGRFIGAGGQSESKSIVSSIKDYLSGAANGIGSTNGRGVDPTIDAIGELKDTLSPIGGIFKKMTAKSISLFTGRRKKNATDDTIPAEQAKANELEQRSDKERNGLLRRVIDAILRMRSGGLLGGGLLGGLLGGGGGKGGAIRAVLRKVPILGALLGGGALATSWNTTENKERGRGVGELGGMVVGGALGSFLGIPGAIAGGYVGHKLGGIFGAKVGEWTDDLKKIDFGDLFKDAVKAIFTKSPAGMVMGAAKSAQGWVKEKLSGGTGASRVNGRGAGAGYGGKTYAYDPSTSASTNKKYAPILDFIGLSETGYAGKEAYDTMVRGSKITPESMFGKPLSQLTLKQVKELQKANLNEQKKRGVPFNSRSSAVGRYQILNSSIDDYMKKAGIKDDDVFNAQVQDAMAVAMLRGGKYGLDNVEAGKASIADFQNKVLAGQWASIKKTNGKGAHDGIGSNVARHGSVDQVAGLVNQVMTNSSGRIVGKEALQGLRIKSAESIAGGGVKDYTASFAQLTQRELDNLNRFTAFNDKFHKNKKSKHNQGEAFDITLKDPSKSAEAKRKLEEIAAKNGYQVKVLDEYKNPSKHSTGGHLHVSVTGFKGAVKEAEKAQIKAAAKSATTAANKPKPTLAKAPKAYETVIPYKHGAKPQQTARVQDTNMGQNVSDRSLAHIVTGGIGRSIG